MRTPRSTRHRSRSALLLPFASAVGLMMALACGEPVTTGPTNQQDESGSVATVEIVAPRDSLRALGATTQLSATARNSAGEEIGSPSFSWSSSDPMVATVSSSGLVGAIGVGTATISATEGGVSDTLSITVLQFVSTVEIRTANDSLTALGDTIRLNAVARDSLGAAVPNVGVSWSSADPLVAEVDSSGLVLAMANGTASIRALMDTATGSIDMVVYQLTATVIFDTPGVALSDIGSTWDFDATAWDRLDNEIVGRQFTWSTLNDDVATISPDGLATSHRDGQATIVAEVDGTAGHALVTVSIPSQGQPRTWSHGAFQRFEVEAIWGTGPSDIWAVGVDPATPYTKRGRIVHYDGSEWLDASPALGDRSPLFAISGSANTNVWAVGEQAVSYSIKGLVLHYDGSAWNDVTPTEITTSPYGTSLEAVWSSGSDSVWVGGWNTLAHYDGTSWSFPVSQPGVVYDIWGSGPDDVWAVGMRGTMHHCQGSTCDTVNAPVARDLHGVWGSGPNDVWAVGEVGSVFHYDGNSWVDVSPGLVNNGLWDVWGSGPADVWIAADFGKTLHYDGSTWTEYSPASARLKAVWSSGPTDAWTAGSRGYFFHHDGVEWSDASPGVTYSNLYDVWGADPGDVWAVGDRGSIAHYDGVNWSSQGKDPQDWPRATFPEFRSVWGVNAENVWSVARNGGIFFHDGSGWTEVWYQHSARLIAVWGSGPADVWALEDGVSAIHYDGTEWTRVRFNLAVSSLTDLWGTGANDIWAVGYSGTIVHYDGSAWTDLTPGLTHRRLTSVWGSGPDDVWAVGQNGTILHYDGASWSDVSPGHATHNYSRVFGTGPNDVWVVGLQGVLLHYNGTGWTEVQHDLTELWLIGLWGTAQSNLWAAGAYGVTLMGSP